MTTNKKLLIGLACLAFCVCCAIFGFGFKGKNSLVAQADTIPQAPSAVALAAPAKSIKLDSHEAEDQAVTEEPIEDEDEEIEEEFIEEDDADEETEKFEDEILEEDGSYETTGVSPFRHNVCTLHLKAL